MEVRICLGRAKAPQETLSLHERDRCAEGDETVDRDDDNWSGSVYNPGEVLPARMQVHDTVVSSDRIISAQPTIK